MVPTTLGGAVATAITTSEVKHKFAIQGFASMLMNADQLKTYIFAETAKWIQVTNDAKMEPQ
jgi:tripartite-type tricarboxylate transporter receptor subunit TctC